MVSFHTMPRLDSEALWQFALKALAGRGHSAGEMREKLYRKAERPADVEAVLSRLKECGYLDDKRFADTFANARLQNQGLGKARVLHDLRQRRVAPALAGRAVENVYKDADEVQLIQAFISRKYRAQEGKSLFQAPTELASAYRRLRRAGFSGGNVIRVLKKLAKQPESLDQIEPETEE